MTTVQTVNHSSLSHLLNPTTSDLGHPNEPEDQPTMCSSVNKPSTAEHIFSQLDKPLSTAEHVNTPPSNIDAMMVDILPSDTSPDNAEEDSNHDMQVDVHESQTGGGEQPGTKKTGLLGWLNISTSKKRKQADTDISSLNSGKSDSASKKGLEGNKSVAKKLKSVAGAVVGPGVSRAATASRELRKMVRSGEFKPNPVKVAK
jgi:hypothetical protein